MDPLYLAEILSLLLHKKQMHHSWLKLHVSGLHIPNSKISKSDVVETCLTMVLDNIAQPDLFQYQVIVNYSVKSALVRLIETFCLKKLLVGNCWQHDKQKTGKMIISQHCNIALFWKKQEDYVTGMSSTSVMTTQIHIRTKRLTMKMQKSVKSFLTSKVGGRARPTDRVA